MKNARLTVCWILVGCLGLFVSDADAQRGARPSYHPTPHPSYHPTPHPSYHPTPHSSPHTTPHPSPHVGGRAEYVPDRFLARRPTNSRETPPKDVSTERPFERERTLEYPIPNLQEV